jgi:DNA-binding NarL/FixJ family response regulator
MACDEKQALDLLAILRPDTVLVDVRGAGQPTIDFLDALGPESGRILTLLVHGDPSGATLSKLAERLLRPPALDVNELVKVCRNALPETGKRGTAAPARSTR